MPLATATVRFSPASDCFVRFSSNLQTTLSPSSDSQSHGGGGRLFLLVLADGTSVPVHWNGEWYAAAAASAEVRIAGIYGLCLGVRDGDVVSVSRADYRPVRCESVTLEPIDENEWELLQLHSDYIENHLLEQAGVVAPAQEFPVWLVGNLVVFLRVVNLSPRTEAGCVSLENATEVILRPPSGDRIDFSASGGAAVAEAPPPDHSSSSAAPLKLVSPDTTPRAGLLSRIAEGLLDTVQLLLVGPGPLLSAAAPGRARSQLALQRAPLAWTLRVQRLTRPDVCQQGANPSGSPVQFWRQPTVVLVRRATVARQSCGQSLPAHFVGQLSSSTTAGRPSCCVHVVVLDEGLWSGDADVDRPAFWPMARNLKPGHILVHSVLGDQFGFTEKSYICLETVSSDYTSLNVLHIHHLDDLEDEELDSVMIRMAFVHWLESICSVDFPLVLPDRIVIRLPLTESRSLCVGLALRGFAETVNLSYFVLSSTENFQINVEAWKGRVTTNFDDLKQSLINADSSSEMSLGDRVLHVDGFVQDVVAHCSLGGTAVLLTGPSGSGKSVVGKAIVDSLASEPFIFHAQSLNCTELRGKTVSSVVRKFRDLFEAAVEHQPSVVFLDNIDVILPAVDNPDHDVENMAALSCELGHWFLEIRELPALNSGAVSLLATAASRASLHPNLLRSRGFRTFDQILPLPALSRSQMFDILRSQAEDRFGFSFECSDGEKEAFMQKLDHFLPCDIVRILSQLALTETDAVLSVGKLRDVLEAYRPLALIGVVTDTQPNTVSWNDIGGLKSVKSTIVETVMWPLRFPSLFRDSPIRLCSGLLLYGYPGTGKTVLASSVAAHCGLRFLSVNGPELLNKYIGASEQAVRDLFRRAESCRPCLVFFDEFDSLAAPRGHDNTGVTDRVVNQLLTLLDGVESLASGVFVMAATSRPDLIDPALLRPGRLDRSLFLGMPSAADRLEILTRLCRGARLAPDVDLAVVARAARRFTGADLQGLVSTAIASSIRNRDVDRFELIASMDGDGRLSTCSVAHLGNLEQQGTDLELHDQGRSLDFFCSVDDAPYPEGGGDSTDAPSELCLSQSDFDHAIENSKPALSERDMQKFASVYQRFRVRTTDQKSAEKDDFSQILPRATLS